MTALAPTLEAFFTERLIGQRQASPNTIAAYRDAWRLLLGFARKPHRQAALPARHRRPRRPADRRRSSTTSKPSVATASAPATPAWPPSAASSPSPLCATPSTPALIARVLAIPTKRCDRAVVTYLDDNEVRRPGRQPRPDTAGCGRRDHALLAVAFQTGLRVSELTGLRNRDVELGSGAPLRCRGKGRKATSHPVALRHRRGAARLDERTPAAPPKTRCSRPGPEHRSPETQSGPLVEKHAATAAQHQPSLAAKKITPHVLRHYGDDWVMWPAGVFPLTGLPRLPILAT